MGVLSAPTSPQNIHVLNSVILTVSILSALGAGWIILSFLVSLKKSLALRPV
jgi:hypothetical protein